MVSRRKAKEDKKRKKEQVAISNNLVLKRLLRPARYFDGLINNSRRYNPTKLPRRPCLICASSQHVTKHCSTKQRDKDCGTDKAVSVCLRCGGLGHDMGLCTYEYTEDDLESVQCYVCKRFGHLCCVDEEACDSSPSSLWAVSCYGCGQVGHTGLECGRHYEGSLEIESGFGRVKEADKTKKHSEKAVATSAAIRASTPHESNGTMTKKKKKNRKKKNNKNLEQHVTAHESDGEKNNGDLVQRSTFHESKGKAKKNNVESEPSCNRKMKKNTEGKDEQPLIAEKPNLRSGWITEDLEENPFHRGNIRRLSSPTIQSGHDRHILPVSPPSHNHRSSTAHIGHNYGSPRFISGEQYPDSHSTTPYDRNRTNSSFEYNGHLWDPPPSRLWERNYPPTSPIAPLGHSHHRLPVTPPGHNHRSPTFSSGGHYTGSLSTVPFGGHHRYSSFESNRHLLDPPFSTLRQSYYSPTSPIAPSGHNHRLPTFSYGEHHTGSLSTIPPHGGNHRDSSFEYNERHLDPPPFSRWQPYYQSTAPITPAGHHHHMLPSTYLDRYHMLASTYNQRSPTFNSGGHYSSPMSSTRYGGNHGNSPFESDGYLLGPSTSRWLPYYPPTSSHHQQQNIYGHAPSRYDPPHHYGEFSGNYERW